MTQNSDQLRAQAVTLRASAKDTREMAAQHLKEAGTETIVYAFMIKKAAEDELLAQQLDDLADNGWKAADDVGHD
jgi:hypothetical protein